MKLPRILVLLISTMFLGCAKEDGVGITKFIGNNIDSVVQYNLTANLDTIAAFARKFTYSEDKKITKEQWYERVEGQEKLVPTVSNTYTINGYKLIKKSAYLNDTTTFEYKFNSNLFVISYIKRSNNSPEYDSVFYQYDDDNFLYSIKRIYLNNSGEAPYRVVSNYYYSWVDGNLTKVGVKQYTNNTLIYYWTNYFQYGVFKNPIDYYCDSFSPYLRYGRASKNLVDNIEYTINGNPSGLSNFSYLLFPSTKSFLEKSYRENYQTLTKIFYK